MRTLLTLLHRVGSGRRGSVSSNWRGACNRARRGGEYLLPVGGGEVDQETFVHIAVAFQDSRRRGRRGNGPCWERNGQARRRAGRSQEAPAWRSPRRRSSRHTKPATTCVAAGMNSMSTLGVAELNREVAEHLLDAVEPVDEVHVPRGTAELRVGGRTGDRRPPACAQPPRSPRPPVRRSSSALIRPCAKLSRAAVAPAGAAGCRRGRRGRGGLVRDATYMRRRAWYVVPVSLRRGRRR